MGRRGTYGGAREATNAAATRLPHARTPAPDLAELRCALAVRDSFRAGSGTGPQLVPACAPKVAGVDRDRRCAYPVVSATGVPPTVCRQRAPASAVDGGCMPPNSLPQTSALREP
jgi:hypothetical protein